MHANRKTDNKTGEPKTYCQFKFVAFFMYHRACANINRKPFIDRFGYFNTTSVVPGFGKAIIALIPVR